MLKVKGVAVKSTTAYIKDTLGDRFSSWSETLDEQSKSIATGPIISSDFYDASLVAGLAENFASYIGENPSTTYHKLGRASSDYGLNTVYRIFMKLGSPEYILKKAPLVWKSYYSQGTFKICQSTPVSAVVQIVEVTLPHSAICGRITGWMERTLELSGARNISIVHTSCGLKGQGIEEWHSHWDM